MKIEYKGYTISPSGDPYNLQPYTFVHKDYDGAPDSGDNRCGTGKSIEECKEQILENEYL